MIEVKIKTEPGAREPEYQTGDSAGADIFAFIEEPLSVAPGETRLISTGIRIEIPAGFEAQIRPRSGLALKNGLTLLNSPGTIDADYRGEIKIILTNLGSETFIVENGMRVAQMVFSKVYRGSFQKSENLNNTSRNEGGFGHSGV